MRGIVIFIVLVVLVVGGLVIKQKFAPGPKLPIGTGKNTGPKRPTKGFVATMDLPARGVVVGAFAHEQVEEKGFPTDIVTKLDELDGYVLDAGLREGQPILKSNLKGKVRPALLPSSSPGRLLVMQDVSAPPEGRARISLLPGTRLRAVLGLEPRFAPVSNTTAGENGESETGEGTNSKGVAPGKLQTRPAPRPAEPVEPAQPPIFVTILFASGPTLQGPDLWEKRPDGPDPVSRDLLLSVPVPDAMRIGEAIRDGTMGLSMPAVTAPVNVEWWKTNKGVAVIDIDDVAREKYLADEKQRTEVALIGQRLLSEAEKKRAREAILDEARFRNELAELVKKGIPPPVPLKHYCLMGNPQCGFFKARKEIIEREIDVYQGRTSTKTKVIEGERMVQDWVFYAGHAAGIVLAGTAGEAGGGIGPLPPVMPGITP